MKRLAFPSGPAALDPWLAAILAAGLLIRLPALGLVVYAPDIDYWKSWLTFAVGHGIQNVYALRLPGQTYPPLLLYVFWGLGWLFRWILPGVVDSAWLTAFVKLPGVAGDLIAAWAIARYARAHGGPGRIGPRGAAALLAFHPALLWLSSFWGQFDVITGLLAAGAWGAVLAGSPAAAGALLALGVLAKPQGLIVLPAAAVLLARRTGGRGLARAAGAGVAVAIPVLLPFALAGYGGRLVEIYVRAGNVYPFVSMKGFNPWWCVSILRPGGWTRALMSDAVRVGGVVSLHAIGLALFLLATAWIVARCAREPSPARAWRLLTLQWLAFFLLPTQIHERYLVPALVSLAPAVVLEPRRWLGVYAALSAGILLNLLFVAPGAPALLAAAVWISGRGVIAAAAFCAIAVLLVRSEIRG